MRDDGGSCVHRGLQAEGTGIINPNVQMRGRHYRFNLFLDEDDFFEEEDRHPIPTVTYSSPTARRVGGSCKYTRCK